MSRRAFLSRRKLSALIALLPSFLLQGPAAAIQPGDRGIGGTGRTDDPEDELRDRGIGGTGVVGTIRGFGSIIVNGLRIVYPKRVRVVIDGRESQASDLRLGQVVRANATRRGRNLLTRMITVDSEVIGPIESIQPNAFVVLGQQIIPTVPVHWQLGDIVAVSGLRRTDGAIAASLIDKWPSSISQVVGPVVQGDDGEPHIGVLRLEGLPSDFVGQRCVIRGQYLDGTLVVAEAQDERALLLTAKPSRLSIEAFIRRSQDGVILGSGLRISSAPGEASASSTDEYSAVLTVVVRAQGELAITHVQVEGRHDGRPGDRASQSMPGPAYQGGNPNLSAPGESGPGPGPPGAAPGVPAGPGNPAWGGAGPGSRGPGPGIGGGPGGGPSRGGGSRSGL